MRFLTAATHGVVDYILVVALALAPTLFQLHGIPAFVAYLLAVVHLAVSLSTRYPLGVLKRIPYGVHGLLELVVSISLVALPWLAGFETDAVARSVYIGLGILLFAVWVLSDYGAHAPHRPDEPAAR